MTIDKREEDKRKLFKYTSFRWGPCVIKFKVDEDFRQRLLVEAEQVTQITELNLQEF